MKLETQDEYRRFLMLVCLMKVYHDAGINVFMDMYSEDVINDFDYYYEYIMNAIENTAPIVISSENLYRKYGITAEYGDAYVWAYSCKEMREYYKLARKLHRLEGNSTKNNVYITDIERDVEDIRGFMSYAFDYDIGNKRRGAQLELIWSYEFCDEIAMCLWVVRTMDLFRKELPELKEKYRRVRREKRMQRNRLRKGEELYEAA